ncbi:MAG: FixH family protein [Desulfuromonadales bacterium]|nr:FixH family protein [Desulfuromonadales bacterium]
MVFIVAISTASMAVSAAPIRIAATDTPPGGAVLELYTDELVTMTAIPFRITIRDAAGRPLTGAKVSCEMTMPSMTMPENRPRVTERDGVYGGELVFTCALGAWRIGCLAEKADGSRQVMTFDIEKVRMK